MAVYHTLERAFNAPLGEGFSIVVMIPRLLTYLPARRLRFCARDRRREATTMGLAALLIIVIVVGSWLAFFIGVGVAIYRHAQRRGRRIILSGAGVTLLLIVSLVALNVSFRPSAPQSRPSPSRSILAASWSDSQNHPMMGGVNARDGALRWRRALTVSYRGEEPTADGVLYVEDGATISAVRLSDGALLWQRGSTGVTIVSPLIVRGGELLYISYQGVFDANALDLASHTLRWSRPLSDFLLDNVRAPFAASADLLFFGSHAGAVSALRLSDGSLAWSRQPLAASVGPTPVWVTLGASQIFAFTDDGQIVALRPADGAPLWQGPAGLRPAGQNYLTATATSVYACVLFTTANGDFTDALAALDPANGAIRWERASVCGINGIHILSESAGILYLLGPTLIALRASDGATLWSANTGATDLGFTTGEVDSGVVFVAATVIFPRDYTTCAKWWSGGPLFCHSPNFIAAYDAASGAHYWSTTLGDAARFISGAAA